MNRTRLFVREATINKVIGRRLRLSLDNKATLVDAISKVDEMMSSKGGLPVPDYQSLLHMICLHALRMRAPQRVRSESGTQVFACMLTSAIL